MPRVSECGLRMLERLGQQGEKILQLECPVLWQICAVDGVGGPVPAEFGAQGRGGKAAAPNSGRAAPPKFAGPRGPPSTPRGPAGAAVQGPGDLRGLAQLQGLGAGNFEPRGRDGLEEPPRLLIGQKCAASQRTATHWGGRALQRAA